MNNVMQTIYSLLLDTFASIDIPVLLADDQDKIVSLNYTVGQGLQYCPSDLTGHSLRDVINITANIDNVRPVAPLPDLPAIPLTGHRDTTHYEASCRRKDGSLFLARVSVIPFPQDCLKLVVIQNISDRKKLQQKASQRTKELSIFNTFAKILTRHIPTDKVLQETVDMLASIMEAQQAWIYLIDENYRRALSEGPAWHGRKHCV